MKVAFPNGESRNAGTVRPMTASALAAGEAPSRVELPKDARQPWKNISNDASAQSDVGGVKDPLIAVRVREYAVSFSLNGHALIHPETNVAGSPQ